MPVMAYIVILLSAIIYIYILYILDLYNIIIHLLNYELNRLIILTVIYPNYDIIYNIALKMVSPWNIFLMFNAF